MGIRLVNLVLNRWAQLPDRAFRALVRMAATALDMPQEGRPAATYFAGRDPIADVMLVKRGGTRATAVRTGTRAIDDLVKAGAVEHVDKGRSGHRAVYRLTLEKTPTIEGSHSRSESQRDTRCPAEGDTRCPAEEDTRCPAEEDTRCRDRETPGVPPRRTEEQREEQLEEGSEDLLPVVQAVDTTGGAPPPDPRRPQTAPPSPPGNESTSSISSAEQDPPQPETATHDRAREDDAGPGRILRLIEGNPAATRSDREEPHLAPVPEAAPVPTLPAPVLPARRWSTRGQDTVAEAMARRAADREAHRRAQQNPTA